MLHLLSLISVFVSFKCGYADSADPAHGPNLDLGKDTVVPEPPQPTPPPNTPNERWVRKRPIEYDCLQDFSRGCHEIKDRRTCLSSLDGRNKTDTAGIKILGEPCTWCGGIACTTGSLHLCEPWDFLVNGQGKEFLDFTAKKIYTVAKCKNGRPVLPERREPVLALADAGRHQSCGDQKVYTVPHIKDTYTTCSNFCSNKASVTWPYGKLGWNCIKAWYADGNTCHQLRETSCENKFDDWMDVALCQCQGKQLPNPYVPIRSRGPVITTTTKIAPPCNGCSFMSWCIPWWLLWLPLLLCLLCLCCLLLLRFCKDVKKPPTKREIEFEEPENEKWIRISEGTQTPAKQTTTREINLSNQAQAQNASLSMIQPFETVVEVVPKSGDLYTSQTLIQPAQPTLFDLIDANHDGVITRQELAAAGGSTSAQANTQFQLQTAVLHSEPQQNMQSSEPMMNVGPTEPVMNRPSQLSGGGSFQSTSQGLSSQSLSRELMQGTVQVVPTTQMLTETQVLQPMQAVQGQQMDLLTVTPWGYSVNHMGR